MSSSTINDWARREWKMREGWFCRGALLLACVALAIAANAQQPVPSRQPLSAEEVVRNLVQRNLARANALPAFRATRVYRADYRGFPGARSAELVVDVVYEPPDRKTFAIRSEAGSKLIIDRVFKKLMDSEKEAFEAENQKRTALNDENYTFKMLAYRATPSGATYEMAVEPKIRNKFLYRGTIWVDADDFAVTRIAAEPARNPSFWLRNTHIEQTYRKVNEFWLPERNHSVSTVRLGGRADFSIDYRDYQMPLASGAGR